MPAAVVSNALADADRRRPRPRRQHDDGPPRQGPAPSWPWAAMWPDPRHPSDTCGDMPPVASPSGKRTIATIPGRDICSGVGQVSRRPGDPASRQAHPAPLKYVSTRVPCAGHRARPQMFARFVCSSAGAPRRGLVLPLVSNRHVAPESWLHAPSLVTGKAPGFPGLLNLAATPQAMVIPLAAGVLTPAMDEHESRSSRSGARRCWRAVGRRRRSYLEE